MTEYLLAETNQVLPSDHAITNTTIFAVFVLITLVVVYRVGSMASSSDYFVAGSTFTGLQNGIALSGDFLSAASFLGIAGLQMKLGSAALWLPLGFTAGYLALLLFVAAPLRRFGAYTISDFAEARLGSFRCVWYRPPRVRWSCASRRGSPPSWTRWPMIAAASG